MQGFPGELPDFQLLQATMRAVEHACLLFQMHMDPGEGGGVLLLLHSSPMPYQKCRFILENSPVQSAKFQAAGSIGDAAIREWALLSDENKKCLVMFCLNYIMEHTNTTDAYVQSKVSSVAALLLKRGWLEFPETEKTIIFVQIQQSISGIHGSAAQLLGLNFLEALVSEFSPSTSSSMGLPAEFHVQCQSSLELYLKDFYCWAQTAALTISEKLVSSDASVLEEKVCTAALQLMVQILSWNFTCSALEARNQRSMTTSGIRHDTIMLKKFDRSLVKPGSTWTDTLVTSGNTTWLLNFYNMMRLKNSSDTLWGDSVFAISARQLIVLLSSLTGTVFPNDNGETQIRHLIQILSAILQWVDPPDAISLMIQNGQSASEFIDGCHVLLSISLLTSTTLFDQLLNSVRPYGTISMLCALTSEAVKVAVLSPNENEPWAPDALDVLLEIWNVILGVLNAADNSISGDGVFAASSLFSVIVETYLKGAADSAFEDNDENEYFHASISKRDELLASYALISRCAVESTVPLLTRQFTEHVARLNQQSGHLGDPTALLEELYWLLLITGHVLTDSGDGEMLMVPEALLKGFTQVVEAAQHPVIILSWSVINFSRECLDPQKRAKYFSPRLMEAVVWFLARWIGTYLTPLDINRQQNENVESNGGMTHESKLSGRFLCSFVWEHGQGEAVLDLAVQISVIALTAYPGENDLHMLTCQELLQTIVRQKKICAHLVQLESWRDLSRMFATEATLFSIRGRLQRALAETLVNAASCIKDSELSFRYLKELLGPLTSCFLEQGRRNDLKSVAQNADVVFLVSCMLERLRGAARGTQPHTQKAIFEMGCTVMSSLLILLQIYRNQPAVVYLILKFVNDFVDGQVAFLNAKENSVLVGFCLQLLQTYSSHNIGKMSISVSGNLQTESQTEKYKDLRALLQLLTIFCSKDWVDFSDGSDQEERPDIAEVIFVGLHIISPLISLDLLKYPKLRRDYFALVSHLLEVYPEKLVRLRKEAFSQIITTLDFGLFQQDIDDVDKCFSAVNALASYHFKERIAGKEGLSAQLIELADRNGTSQETISNHFLRLLLQLILFGDFSMELVASAADALLPLMLCEQDHYQRLVQEILEKQSNPALRSRLANAFHSLTNSNNISFSLDRMNKRSFRKNLREFLTETAGFMRIK